MELRPVSTKNKRRIRPKGHMKVLVCGGRDYNDWDTLCEVLNKYIAKITDGGVSPPTQDDLLIQGDAPGADRLAKRWAENWSMPVQTFKADWDYYGKRAGYLRNKRMLDEGKPDLVIAFPGGAGTAMMIKLAEEAGVKVVKIER